MWISSQHVGYRERERETERERERERERENFILFYVDISAKKKITPSFPFYFSRIFLLRDERLEFVFVCSNNFHFILGETISGVSWVNIVRVQDRSILETADNKTGYKEVAQFNCVSELFL